MFKYIIMQMRKVNCEKGYWLGAYVEVDINGFPWAFVVVVVVVVVAVVVAVVVVVVDSEKLSQVKRMRSEYMQ